MLPKKSGRRAVVWGLSALLVLASAPLAAQSDGGLEKFTAHVKRGAQLRKDGKPREALAEFEKARAIADHPKLAFAIGRIYEDIGDCGAARQSFERGLEDERSRGALAAKFEEALEQNRQCTDRGVLTVHCEPTNARLLIDGEPTPCPAEVELSAGEHTLEASAPDSETRTQTIRVEPAGQHHETIELGEPWQRTTVTYAKYGALGVGGALLVGGIISDASASSRQDELAEATRQGDVARANRLADEADSAQTRTVVLYSLGALFVAGGAALWAYDAEAEALLAGDDSTPAASVEIRGDGASIWATFHW